MGSARIKNILMTIMLTEESVNKKEEWDTHFISNDREVPRETLKKNSTLVLGRDGTVLNAIYYNCRKPGQLH